MRTCLLNPPHPARIMRRYNCSYFAPNFLFPPLELMYIGAIIKKWKKDDCILIDAIAQKLSLNKVISRLKSYNPELLVFMPGLETFRQDLDMINAIKSHLPFLKIAAIGYLPSLIPKETLENNPALDYIIMDEPELTFSKLYDCLKANTIPAYLPGIACRDTTEIFLGDKERIKDLDRLPFPERSLINQGLYNEFLLKRPFATMQTSRGCPFECTFCIRTYGREFYYRSIENVISEIDEVIFKYKAKNIRFMDDIFTLNKNRVIKLCEAILEKKFSFQWSCLARVDTLDNSMLAVMKRSGCKRIYLGIETGSQRLLDFYKKGYSASLLKEQVSCIKKIGIETFGFFMVGGIQTEDELKNDISLAKRLELDYVGPEKLTVYPGIPLFGLLKEMDLEKAIKWEKIFYRSFYLRPGYIIRKFTNFIFYPGDTLCCISKIFAYLFRFLQFYPSSKYIIAGVKENRCPGNKNLHNHAFNRNKIILHLILKGKFKYIYASIRRRFIFYFRKGYFSKQMSKRSGQCLSSGHCCAMAMPQCLYFKDGKCAIYDKQPFFCKIFPIDERDKELSEVKDKCSFYFV